MQVTEWWLIPRDINGDSIDIIFCKSKKETETEKLDRVNDFEGAVEWTVEKCVRQYASDGELLDEKLTEV